MKILSHRGYWRNSEERNTGRAFIRALEFGFGIELDVRDRRGQLVISHNPADNKSLLLKDFFDIYKKYAASPVLAINVKADGLEKLLNELLIQYKIRNYFVFDISVPALFHLRNRYKNVVFAVRHSDLEKTPAFCATAKWVVMDELNKEWINNYAITRHVRNGKKVCIISPELHKRSCEKAWASYRRLPKQISQQVYLCTDLCESASHFFGIDKKKDG